MKTENRILKVEIWHYNLEILEGKVEIGMDIKGK